MPKSGGLADQLFLYACGFARTATQVIKFSTAHITAALDLDTGDLGGIQLERTFDGFARRDLANGECRVQATVTTADDDAFVCLDALARAFDHVHIHDNGVARSEIGQAAAFGEAQIGRASCRERVCQYV